ncbi:MAG TPA: oligosaccharide flippase family protein [Verrucomicrobiae bacterium]|nr:oligosaccharide flippase family protein [Verrucomicrobiae bacterium]
MKPVVSILIPAYNAEKWIAETIASARAQTWANKEIIIVDDGSKDQTLSVARRFASKSINVISQSNRGAAAARNKAFSLCQGDYIQWMDADDLLSPDKIAGQMEAVEQFADRRKLFSCGWGSFFCRPKKARFHPTGLWADLTSVEWLVRKMIEHTWMQPGTWLVSRELTEAAGPWDERLSLDDDGEYFCRVLLESAGVKFVGGPAVFYRVRHGSLGSVDGSDKKLESAWLSMRLHVQYLRSIEDSARTRVASIKYLQNLLPNFYPERPDIIEQAQELAKSLGGQLETPKLPQEYSRIEKTMGWRAAKAIQRAHRDWKIVAHRTWDRSVYNLEALAKNVSRMLSRMLTMDKSKEFHEAANDELLPPLPGALIQVGVDGANDMHFRTDHLLDNLKNRTVSGGFVTVTSQAIQFFLVLGSTMILARLLTPRDFGLVAMVSTLTGFLWVFRDAGLSIATVQRDGITHAQVSNLFWVNVVVSGMVGLLVAASAPLLAWFFHEPRLMPITFALSSVFLLTGLAVQHTALLSRQMRFKTIAVIQIGSVLAGVLVGVGTAWLNFGYWSLVWMNLTTNIVALLLTWSASGWRPQLFKRHSGTRSLLNLGANLTAGTFIYTLAFRLDGLLIGRVWGAASLGLYSRASAMLSKPLGQFIAPIEAVVIPAFSRLQTQPERYRQNFIPLYEGMALAGFFFTGMFFALARPLTLVVLGPKWENAAVIFAALSFASLQIPLGQCATWLINSQGRGKDAFSASWINAIVVAISFIIGLPFGAAGVAIGYSAGALLIQLPIYYWIVGRSGPVRTRDLWIGFVKHLPVWGVVTLTALLALKAVPNFSSLAQLAVCIPASFLAGIAFIFLYTPSRRIAVQIFSVLRELKQSAAGAEIAGDDSPREAKMADAESEVVPPQGAPNGQPTLTPN